MQIKHLSGSAAPRCVGAHGDINQPAEGDSQPGDGHGVNDVARTEQPLGFISFPLLHAAAAARRSLPQQMHTDHRIRYSRSVLH